jgi:hypothetical protein
MANNYLQFSEVIPQLTTQEADWLRAQLEVVCVFGELEHPEDKLPSRLNRDEADWIGCRAYRDLLGYDPEWGWDVGFEYQFSRDDRDKDWGRHLWLYADESGAADRVAHLVQKFLKEFRPDESWSLTWAVSCSKPRVGEFGGGAVFVTAEEITWQDAHDFAADRQLSLQPRRDIVALIARAQTLGVQVTDLDEAVHEAASSLASTVNNCGVADQVEWLIGRQGLGAIKDMIDTLASHQPQDSPSRKKPADEHRD